MPATDLQGIRDFVRVSLDTDSDELPDTLLDVYISEGYNNALSVSDTWNFLGVEYTITTTPTIQQYDFAGTNRDPGILSDLESITDLRGDTWSLRSVDHAAIRAALRRTNPSSATPWAWSEIGQSLFLWPIPSATATIYISGYRAPIDWISQGSGGVPDCPTDFNEALSFHALSRGWAQQSDPDMANYYDAQFEKTIQRMKQKYATPTGSGPYIQNGGVNVGIAARNGLGPLIWPWD